MSYFTASATTFASNGSVRSKSKFDRYATKRSFEGTRTIIELNPSGEIAPLCHS